MQTIKRNDGTPLATFNHDGDHFFMTVRVPDGYAGRDAPILLERNEAERFIDAFDREMVELDICGKG